MADDESPIRRKVVSGIFEVIALALVLGAEESWRSGKPLHSWAGEGTVGLVFQVAFFTWHRAFLYLRKIGPWEELRQAKLELSNRISSPTLHKSSTDMYALPPDASNGDRMRRHRAVTAFNKLSVPQRFALRCISKHQRVSFNNLVQFGQEAGFGADPSGYINYMTSFCELIRVEGNNDFMIEPAFIGDVEIILTAWFTRIATSSEPLF